MKTDIYKQFKLVPPLCGLVNKVTSPRGMIRHDNNSYTSYQFYSDLKDVYHKEATELEPGIYWVLDICFVKRELTWNQYLFVATEDSIYPVGEYLDQKDSTWVKKGLSLVKRYLAGEKLPAIELTSIDYKMPKKAKWSLHKDP